LRDIKRRADAAVQDYIKKLTTEADSKIMEGVNRTNSKIEQEFEEIRIGIRQKQKDLDGSVKEDVIKVTFDFVKKRLNWTLSTEKWIIWVDDQPDTTLAIRNVFKTNNINVETPTSTNEVATLLANPPQGKKFELLVSDMRRGNNPREGLDYFQKIKGQPYPPRLIFGPKSLLEPLSGEIDDLIKDDPLFLGAVSANEPFFDKVLNKLR